ncbi:tRNA epoxyqueuosine(34) reductase QueG [Dysgonomonas sp. 511]|uniref:tRNA epoxyqueuosine(34) reductase QueG n=1 Tax=Dysgonomonas sp. 511 TaxID=2302930 RepID=UPI0013D24F64|nr:tRNA epoxyqueuosine(34) reductase QueG [Dysgonomonas sp. 511]NDV79598.1 tRNA epoxyqueuosine(34) reductase QueG [Dysgonomonas sp. 511]
MQTDIITSAQIKKLALETGFDVCGIGKAETVDETNSRRYTEWLANSYHADMDYMARNEEKRLAPTLLVDGCRSVVCVALNYYPKIKQDSNHPQFAYYAYGKDYHDVMNEMLYSLLNKLKSIDGTIEGRAFVDTAPLLERYWAKKSGIGFIGKNSMLIIPKRGSFYFLGELLINKELEYDSPIRLSCGNCTRCIDRCPTRAIVSPGVIDANRCISYQTIENKGVIDEKVAGKLVNCVYGCDICQLACPWNRYARPNSTEAFTPATPFFDLSLERMEEMTEDEYRAIFKGSAVKRAKYSGLKRNLETLKQYRNNNTGNNNVL